MYVYVIFCVCLISVDAGICCEVGVKVKGKVGVLK
jgi:hypothetical protein